MIRLKIHHIGYWVKCIEKEMHVFKMLGYQISSGITYDESRDCYICFMASNEIKIKLIQPASEYSAIKNLLKEHEEQDYHICYETTSFENDLLKLSEKGFHIYDENLFTTDVDNYAVFLSTKNGAKFIEVLAAS